MAQNSDADLNNAARAAMNGRPDWVARDLGKAGIGALGDALRGDQRTNTQIVAQQVERERSDPNATLSEKDAKRLLSNATKAGHELEIFRLTDGKSYQVFDNEKGVRHPNLGTIHLSAGAMEAFNTANVVRVQVAEGPTFTASRGLATPPASPTSAETKAAPVVPPASPTPAETKAAPVVPPASPTPAETKAAPVVPPGPNDAQQKQGITHYQPRPATVLGTADDLKTSADAAKLAYDLRNNKEAAAIVDKFLIDHGISDPHAARNHLSHSAKRNEQLAHDAPISTQERETLGKALINPRLKEDVAKLAEALRKVSGGDHAHEAQAQATGGKTPATQQSQR